MITLLLLYFVPFTICLLFAKLESDNRLDREHLVRCAMFPVMNIVTAIAVIHRVLTKLVK